MTAEPNATVAVEASSTVVRTLRFEVVFPGWRRADLISGSGREMTGLWPDLWRAQDDLRRAANRTISALYQLRLGTLPWPEAEGTRGASKGVVRPVPLRTLVYQALSGSWQPWGEALYQPTGERVSSHALLDLAGLVYTRIQTDWTDIQSGRKSLPTWRSVPIGSPYVEVNRETGEISLSLWTGRGRRISVRPRKLDDRMWRDLRRATKYGGCRLQWDQPTGRKGRWMLSLSAEYPVKSRVMSDLVCAVRLGMYTTCTVAWATRDGKLSKGIDRIDIPASTWRAVRRVESERTERGRWNRRDRGVREGRGRVRKLRAVDGLGDVVARVTDTAVRQVAAAVVASVIRRGAGVIGLPDLARWSISSEMDRTQDLPEADRAAHRRWYLRWHQGALRQRIREAAEREGLRVVDVDPRGSSDECSSCGAVGERAERKFSCTCGCKLPVESNTARVLAKRTAVAAKE